MNDRILGALWGAVVGDALGVPVEFTRRAERQRDPVTDLICTVDQALFARFTERD
jgi:ADP-ribosylglycohydrolase